MPSDFFSGLLKERAYSAVDELKTRIEQLQTKVAELEANIAVMRNSHNRLNGKVTRLQKEVWGNNNRWSLTEEPNE